MTKALMETEAGQLEIELFDTDAPQTVANFVKLVNDGYYDGLAFHRVIDGFMAQGVAPTAEKGQKGWPAPVALATQLTARSTAKNIKLAVFQWPMLERTLAGASSSFAMEPSLTLMVCIQFLVLLEILM